MADEIIKVRIDADMDFSAAQAQLTDAVKTIRGMKEDMTEMPNISRMFNSSLEKTASIVDSVSGKLTTLSERATTMDEDKRDTFIRRGNEAINDANVTYGMQVGSSAYGVQIAREWFKSLPQAVQHEFDAITPQITAIMRSRMSAVVSDGLHFKGGSIEEITSQMMSDRQVQKLIDQNIKAADQNQIKTYLGRVIPNVLPHTKIKQWQEERFGSVVPDRRNPFTHGRPEDMFPQSYRSSFIDAHSYRDLDKSDKFDSKRYMSDKSFSNLLGVFEKYPLAVRAAIASGISTRDSRGVLETKRDITGEDWNRMRGALYDELINRASGPAGDNYLDVYDPKNAKKLAKRLTSSSTGAAMLAMHAIEPMSSPDSWVDPASYTPTGEYVKQQKEARRILDRYATVKYSPFLHGKSLGNNPLSGSNPQPIMIPESLSTDLLGQGKWENNQDISKSLVLISGAGYNPKNKEHFEYVKNLFANGTTIDGVDMVTAGYHGTGSDAVIRLIPRAERDRIEKQEQEWARQNGFSGTYFSNFTSEQLKEALDFDARNFGKGKDPLVDLTYLGKQFDAENKAWSPSANLGLNLEGKRFAVVQTDKEGDGAAFFAGGVVPYSHQSRFALGGKGSVFTFRGETNRDFAEAAGLLDDQGRWMMPGLNGKEFDISGYNGWIPSDVIKNLNAYGHVDPKTGDFIFGKVRTTPQGDQIFDGSNEAISEMMTAALNRYGVRAITNYESDISSDKIGAQMTSFMRINPEIRAQQTESFVRRMQELDTVEGQLRHVFTNQDEDWVARKVNENPQLLATETAQKRVDDYRRALQQRAAAGQFIDFGDSDSLIANEALAESPLRVALAANRNGYIGQKSIEKVRRIMQNAYDDRIANLMELDDQSLSHEERYNRAKATVDKERKRDYTDQELLDLINLAPTKDATGREIERIIDFSHIGEKYEGIMRSPTGYGNFVYGENVAAEIKPVFDALGIASTGVLVSKQALETLQSADYDGDKAKIVTGALATSVRDTIDMVREQSKLIEGANTGIIKTKSKSDYNLADEAAQRAEGFGRNVAAPLAMGGASAGANGMQVDLSNPLNNQFIIANKKMQAMYDAVSTPKKPYDVDLSGEDAYWDTHKLGKVFTKFTDKANTLFQFEPDQLTGDAVKDDAPDVYWALSGGKRREGIAVNMRALKEMGIDRMNLPSINMDSHLMGVGRARGTYLAGQADTTGWDAIADALTQLDYFEGAGDKTKALMATKRQLFPQFASGQRGMLTEAETSSFRTMIAEAKAEIDKQAADAYRPGFGIYEGLDKTTEYASKREFVDAMYKAAGIQAAEQAVDVFGFTEARIKRVLGEDVASQLGVDKTALFAQPAAEASAEAAAKTAEAAAKAASEAVSQQKEATVQAKQTEQQAEQTQRTATTVARPVVETATTVPETAQQEARRKLTEAGIKPKMIDSLMNAPEGMFINGLLNSDFSQLGISGIGPKTTEKIVHALSNTKFLSQGIDNALNAGVDPFTGYVVPDQTEKKTPQEPPVPPTPPTSPVPPTPPTPPVDNSVPGGPGGPGGGPPNNPPPNNPPPNNPPPNNPPIDIGQLLSGFASVESSKMLVSKLIDDYDSVNREQFKIYNAAQNQTEADAFFGIERWRKDKAHRDFAWADAHLDPKVWNAADEQGNVPRELAKEKLDRIDAGYVLATRQWSSDHTTDLLERMKKSIPDIGGEFAAQEEKIKGFSDTIKELESTLQNFQKSRSMLAAKAKRDGGVIPESVEKSDTKTMMKMAEDLKAAQSLQEIGTNNILNGNNERFSEKTSTLFDQMYNRTSSPLEKIDTTVKNYQKDISHEKDMLEKAHEHGTIREEDYQNRSAELQGLEDYANTTFRDDLFDRYMGQYDKTIDRMAAQSNRMSRYHRSRSTMSQISRYMMQNENEYEQRQALQANYQQKLDTLTAARDGHKDASGKIVGGIDAKQDPEKYARVSAAISRLTSEMDKNQSAMDGLHGVSGLLSASFDSVQMSVSRLTARFSRQIFMKALNEAKKFVKEFDQSMTSIQMITLKSDEQMSTLGDGLIKKAQELKISISEISKSAETLYRQGLSDTEVNERLDVISKFSKVSGTKVDAATKLVTVAMNTGLVKNAQQAADIVTALGDNAATNAAEIEKGIEKAGAAAAADGTTFAQLASMLTAITSTTQIGGNVAGRTLNTIFGRMNKIGTNELIYDENGNAVSGSAVAKLLEGEGISMYDEQGNKRSSFETLYALSQKWDQLSDAKQQQFANAIAGTRQYSNFSAIMSGMAEGKVDEYLKLAGESNGITDRKFEIYTKSLNASLTDLRNTWDGLVHDMTDSGALGGALGFLTDFVRGVDKANNSMGGFGITLAGILPSLMIIGGLKTGGIAGYSVAAIGGIWAGITSLIGSQKSAEELYNEYVSQSNEKSSSRKAEISKAKELSDKGSNRTEAEERELDRLLKNISVSVNYSELEEATEEAKKQYRKEHAEEIIDNASGYVQMGAVRDLVGNRETIKQKVMQALNTQNKEFENTEMDSDYMRGIFGSDWTPEQARAYFSKHPVEGDKAKYTPLETLFNWASNKGEENGENTMVKRLMKSDENPNGYELPEDVEENDTEGIIRYLHGRLKMFVNGSQFNINDRHLFEFLSEVYKSDFSPGAKQSERTSAVQAQFRDLFQTSMPTMEEDKKEALIQWAADRFMQTDQTEEDFWDIISDIYGLKEKVVTYDTIQKHLEEALKSATYSEQNRKFDEMSLEYLKNGYYRDRKTNKLISVDEAEAQIDAYNEYAGKFSSQITSDELALIKSASTSGQMPREQQLAVAEELVKQKFGIDISGMFADINEFQASVVDDFINIVTQQAPDLEAIHNHFSARSQEAYDNWQKNNEAAINATEMIQMINRNNWNSIQELYTAVNEQGIVLWDALSADEELAPLLLSAKRDKNGNISAPETLFTDIMSILYARSAEYGDKHVTAADKARRARTAIENVTSNDYFSSYSSVQHAIDEAYQAYKDQYETDRIAALGETPNDLEKIRQFNATYGVMKTREEFINSSEWATRQNEYINGKDIAILQNLLGENLTNRVQNNELTDYQRDYIASVLQNAEYGISGLTAAQQIQGAKSLAGMDVARRRKAIQETPEIVGAWLKGFSESEQYLAALQKRPRERTEDDLKAIEAYDNWMEEMENKSNFKYANDKNASKLYQDFVTLQEGTLTERLGVVNPYITQSRSYMNAQAIMQSGANTAEERKALANVLGLEDKDIKEMMDSTQGKEKLQRMLDDKTGIIFKELVQKLNVDVNSGTLMADIQRAAAERGQDTLDAVNSFFSTIETWAVDAEGNITARAKQAREIKAGDYYAQGKESYEEQTYTNRASEWLLSHFDEVSNLVGKKYVAKTGQKWSLKHHDWGSAITEIADKYGTDASIFKNLWDANTIGLQLATTGENPLVGKDVLQSYLNYKVSGGKYKYDLNSALLKGLFGENVTTSGRFNLENAEQIGEAINNATLDTSSGSYTMWSILGESLPELKDAFQAFKAGDTGIDEFSQALQKVGEAMDKDKIEEILRYIDVSKDLKDILTEIAKGGADAAIGVAKFNAHMEEQRNMLIAAEKVKGKKGKDIAGREKTYIMQLTGLDAGKLRDLSAEDVDSIVGAAKQKKLTEIRNEYLAAAKSANYSGVTGLAYDEKGHVSFEGDIDESVKSLQKIINDTIDRDGVSVNVPVMLQMAGLDFSEETWKKFESSPDYKKYQQQFTDMLNSFAEDPTLDVSKIAINADLTLDTSNVNLKSTQATMVKQWNEYTAKNPFLAQLVMNNAGTAGSTLGQTTLKNGSAVSDLYKQFLNETDPTKKYEKGFELLVGSSLDNNSKYGGSGRGGGGNALTNLQKQQQKRIKPIEHALKMLQAEEKSYDFRNDYSGYTKNIDEQIKKQNELRKAYNTYISDLKAKQKKHKEGSDQWWQFQDAINAAEEALKEVSNTIDELNSKRINILSDELEEKNKPRTHKKNMLETLAETALNSDKFRDYEAYTLQNMSNTKEQKSANTKAIERWKNLLATFEKDSDAWREARDKIWELEEENAELDNQLVQAQLELNQQRLSQIAKVVQENTQTATHNQTIASTYGSAYQSGGYRKQYEQMIKEQQKATKTMIAENMEAEAAAKAQMSTLKKGTTAWFEAEAAVYQYQEAIAQAKVTQMELNRALAESKMDSVAENYNDATREIAHVNDLLSAQAQEYLNTNDYDAYFAAMNSYVENMPSIISAELTALSQLRQQYTSGMKNGTLDPTMQRAYLDEINNRESSLQNLYLSLRQTEREINKVSLDKLFEDQAWAESEFEHNLKLAGYQSSVYQNNGELTNVNTMIEAENDLRRQRVVVLKQEIAELERQHELFSDGSDEEQRIIEQIRKKEEALADENATLDKNNKLLEENKKKIMQVRKTLEDAVDKEIEDEKRRNREILSANVSMQDTIVDLLKKRLQKEWDLKKKDIDKEKEALNEYKQLINERFNYRKKAEQQADKDEELADYRRQLALIEADPSRTKDAKELRRKIEDLEKEQAWTVAEDELNAETERVDDQIEGMDKFVQYNEELLNEILGDANNFATEMNDILSGSFEESYEKILDFMSKENEAFMQSLPAAQKQMIQSWEDTWKKANDIVDSNYTMITSILGDKDTYMDYMKATNRMYRSYQENGDFNSMNILEQQWADLYEDYLSSIKDTAEFTPHVHTLSDVVSMIDELEDNIFKVNIVGIDGTVEGAYGLSTDKTRAKDYSTGAEYKLNDYSDLYSVPEIEPEDVEKEQQASTSSGKKNVSKQEYIVKIDGMGEVKQTAYTPQQAAQQAGAKATNLYGYSVFTQSDNGKTEVLRVNSTKSKGYSSGGLVDYTGLAVVHGSPVRPESFLDATDTKLLRGMMNALNYVRVSPYMSSVDSSMFGNNTNVGDVYVTINQAELKSDADYDKVAKRVGESFSKQLASQGLNLAGYSFN